jgi:dihydropteroate synthase
MILDCAGKVLDLSVPQVMGILNITPDSFSDGGQFSDIDAALFQAERMVEEGAAIIDIGGESTRPGAEAVSVQEELDRVIPVIERLAAAVPLPVSIDSNKPQVMREAVNAGAGLINDVMALQAPGALDVVRELTVPVCMMHMQGQPRSMQRNPVYSDVVDDIMAFFAERIRACQQAGIDRSRLIIDPGFGFGKTLAHNQTLLKHLERFAQLQLPVLVGISRKSMIAAMLDAAPVDQRLFGSLAAAVMAYERGASIIRVHDVKPTVDALRVASAVLQVD